MPALVALVIWSSLLAIGILVRGVMFGLAIAGVSDVPAKAKSKLLRQNVVVLLVIALVTPFATGGVITRPINRIFLGTSFTVLFMLGAVAAALLAQRKNVSGTGRVNSNSE